MNRRRRLGQHYLMDANIVDEVVRAASIQGHERVLEIGAGRGALTMKLRRLGSMLEVYEVDETNYNVLKESVGESEGIRLHLGNAFEASPDFDVLVTSLPYSESGNFIEWLSRRSYSRAIVVLQEEFAQKLLAQPGESSYRAVSVISQASSKVRILRAIGKGAFNPPPRVRSALIEIFFKRQLSSNEVSLVKLLFSQRRRTLAAATRVLDIKENLLGESDRGKRVGRLRPGEVLRIVETLDTDKC